MKKISFYLLAILFAMPILFSTSCEKSKVEEPEKQKATTYYDLWASTGSKKNTTRLVQDVNDLGQDTVISFKNTGADVTSQLNFGSIIKGDYYYQIPKATDRFGKYQIKNDQVQIVAEIKFTNSTLQDRKYSHAWIDDNTLVLFGSDGNYQEVFWKKLNTESMKILAEGTLDIPKPSGKHKDKAEYKYITTSGLASYRKADNKIIYSYAYKTAKGMKGKTYDFHVAFINPADMKVEKIIDEDRAEFMAGTSYGELRQNKTFFSSNGDYYIACNSVLPGAKKRTQQHGNLVRIKAGTTEFDKSYLGFKGKEGKIITVDYLKDNKALLYIEDPKKTGTDWSSKSYNCYYAILDLTTDNVTEIPLPFSQGIFSQRSIVDGDKVYIGINPEKTQPIIYVYDMNSGKATKGLKIAEGYSFDRIVKLSK